MSEFNYQEYHRKEIAAREKSIAITKKNVFAALTAANIEQVDVQFDGEGDSLQPRYDRLIVGPRPRPTVVGGHGVNCAGQASQSQAAP